MASTKIAVTGTSTPLYTLMNTAGSISTVGAYYSKNSANGLIITPEDGNVRVLIGATPTTTVGILLQAGATYTFPGIVLEEFNLIRTGGSNVACSVYPYHAKDGESITIGGGGGGGTPTNPSEIQGVDADNAPATANPVIVSSKYNASAPTYADGDNASLQGDINGNLKTVGQYMPVAEDNVNGVYAVNNLPVAIANYAWSADLSAALEASTVTKATAGLLRQITGRIDSSAGTATYYLQVYNASSLPADGAVTFLITPIKIAHTTGTNTNFTVDLTMNGVYASTGIVVALSSTEFTKTITGALISTLVLYK